MLPGTKTCDLRYIRLVSVRPWVCVFCIFQNLFTVQPPSFQRRVYTTKEREKSGSHESGVLSKRIGDKRLLGGPRDDARSLRLEERRDSHTEMKERRRGGGGKWRGRLTVKNKKFNHNFFCACCCIPILLL